MGALVNVLIYIAIFLAGSFVYTVLTSNGVDYKYIGAIGVALIVFSVLYGLNQNKKEG